MRSIVTVLMKTEDVIIHCNRLGPWECVNMGVRSDNINHYIETVNKQSQWKVCNYLYVN